MPHDGKPLRLLLLKPPKGYCAGPEQRETIRELSGNLRKILHGSQIVLLPAGWRHEIIEVDGLAVKLEK